MNISPSFLALIKAGLTRTALKSTTLAFNKFAPNWTYRKIENFLLAPKSKKVITTNIPHKISLFKIKTREGNLQCYQLGRGPTIVFVHGWSGGAFQFFPLMNGLAKCGFRTLSFDHLAHGHSDGKQASLKQFTSATNAVLQHVNKSPGESLGGIVSHSTGCIAMAKALPKLINGIPLFLISPVFDFKKYFQYHLRHSRLHPDLLKKFLIKFENSYLGEQSKMELKLGTYSADTAIVHDKLDEESDYVDSVKFCSDNPLTNFLVTRKYGHTRIINSESLWQQLKSHFHYEDITSNTNFKIKERLINS